MVAGVVLAGVAVLIVWLGGDSALERTILLKDLENAGAVFGG